MHREDEHHGDSDPVLCDGGFYAITGLSDLAGHRCRGCVRGVLLPPKQELVDADRAWTNQEEQECARAQDQDVFVAAIAAPQSGVLVHEPECTSHIDHEDKTAETSEKPQDEENAGDQFTPARQRRCYIGGRDVHGCEGVAGAPPSLSDGVLPAVHDKEKTKDEAEDKKACVAEERIQFR